MSVDYTEINTKPICKFYTNIYKRMVRWFGYTRPFWLCDMPEDELLTCILRMTMTENMYLIFINVAIRIRENNNRSITVLTQYKKENPNVGRRSLRRLYYADNIDRLREYNRQYQAMRKILCGINIFKKSVERIYENV